MTLSWIALVRQPGLQRPAARIRPDAAPDSYTSYRIPGPASSSGMQNNSMFPGNHEEFSRKSIEAGSSRTWEQMEGHS